MIFLEFEERLRSSPKETIGEDFSSESLSNEDFEINIQTPGECKYLKEENIAEKPSQIQDKELSSKASLVRNFSKPKKFHNPKI